MGNGSLHYQLSVFEKPWLFLAMREQNPSNQPWLGGEIHVHPIKMYAVVLRSLCCFFMFFPPSYPINIWTFPFFWVYLISRFSSGRPEKRCSRQSGSGSRSGAVVRVGPSAPQTWESMRLPLWVCLKMGYTATDPCQVRHYDFMFDHWPLSAMLGSGGAPFLW